MFPFCKEQIKKDLYSLGIRPGDVIMMHSDYTLLKDVEGGAQLF